MPMQPALRGNGKICPLLPLLHLLRGLSPLGCPSPRPPQPLSSPPQLLCTMMPQIQNCHLKVKLCSFLEAIKPWAHLVAQVMGMRWVA